MRKQQVSGGNNFYHSNRDPPTRCARAEAAGLSHKAEKRKLHMKERQRRLGAGDEESKEGRQAERKRKRCVVACHGVVGTVQ